MMKQPRLTTINFTRDDKEIPYIFDRYIFLSVITLLLLVATFFIFSNTLRADKQFFVECINPMGYYCENPLYNNTNFCGTRLLSKDSTFCTQQWLVDKETIGERQPSILKYFDSLTFGLILFAFILNHFLYNLGGKSVN